MPVLYTLRSIRSTMTATPQPYPAYKPSGVEWLGDVPTHWEVVQLGRIGVFSKGSGGTKDDEVPDGIPCVRYGDLYTTHKSFICQTRSYVSPAKASAYTPIHRGDVLFPTSGETIEEIGKSAVNLLDTQVLCGGDTIIFRPTIPMEPKFAGYALDCPAAQTQKSLMGRGITIMHIYSGQLKYLWLSLPPLPEQTAIVRYLDYADRRIRRYVSARRKLIALLEEERHAVVNRAVTRGLDPSIPLKPSGVEWLGDVPAHWEVRRLRTVAEMRVSNVDKHTREDEFPVRLCNYVDVYKNDRITQAMTFMSATASRDEIERFQLKRHDVLITKDSEAWDDIGVPSLVTESADDLLSGYHLALLRPFQEILGAYLARTLENKGVAYQFHVRANGVTRYGMTHTGIQSVRIPLPPLLEQAAIVEHLDKATAGIDAAIARARRQIELVQEYRTRLISDVVTGKLDVRAAAAQLPDEAEDPSTGSGRTGLWPGGPLGDDGDTDPYDAGESLGEEPAMEREVTP